MQGRQLHVLERLDLEKEEVNAKNQPGWVVAGGFGSIVGSQATCPTLQNQQSLPSQYCL